MVACNVEGPPALRSGGRAPKGRCLGLKVRSRRTMCTAPRGRSGVASGPERPQRRYVEVRAIVARNVVRGRGRWTKMDGRFVTWIPDRSVVSDSHEADKNEKRTQNQSRRRTPVYRAEARPYACSGVLGRASRYFFPSSLVSLTSSMSCCARRKFRSSKDSETLLYSGGR